MPSICPSCETELDDAATECPVCLRPRSRQEMFRSLRQKELEPMSARKKAVYAFLVLSLLAGLYLARSYYNSHYMSWVYSGKPQVAMDQNGVPQEPTHRAAPSPAAGRPGAVTVNGQPMVVQTAAPGPEPAPQPPAPVETASPPPQAAKEPEAAPEDKPADLWMIQGVAYDLLDLRPVSGARISFVNSLTGEKHEFKTDARGRYSAKLPRITEGGYEVSVSAKGYRKAYLEEDRPPYSRQSRARREEAGFELSKSLVVHVPILLDPEASQLRHDLILVPLQ